MRLSRRVDLRVSIVACGLALISCAANGQGVVINEVMALNGTTLADDSQEYDDWIELYNPTSLPIDVGGLFLTDDPDDPTLWQIPTGRPLDTVIGPGRFLLIWADQGPGTPGLHGGFKLDGAGESVSLFDRDGATLLDSVVSPRQRTDISYGRDPHDTNQWRYLLVPTPGGPNAQAFVGEVADLTVSHGRGFCDAPFLLEIATDTAGATIVYTVDGGLPCDAFGVRSAGARVYTGPISVSTTTCVRAAACRSGWLSTPVQTHTYIFVGDVVRQSQAAAVAAGYPSSWGAYAADYEMDPEVAADPQYAGLMAESLRAVPTVSIVTDRKGLFDASTGIYTNPLAEGDSLDPLKWERAVSMELLQADGAKEVQVDCGLRIQGGHSRHPNKCPKHSFGLRFRQEYGAASLDYGLFDGWPVRSFDSLQLRGGFNNAWTHWDAGQRERAQYVRDQWARDTLTAMGNPDALQGFSVHLYLNGLYWGLYMLHERPSASHYAAYHGGDPEAIDALNGDPTYVISDPLNTGQVSDGTIDAWLELKAVVAGRDWDRIQQVLDVDNFIDWTILNYYGGNIDLKRGTNWRAAGGGPDRRPWRFYSWDAERILEDLEYTSLGVADATGLFKALDDIEEFRVRFGDRVHRHLFNDGCLTPEKGLRTWMRRADQVEQAVIAESARWGDYRRDLHSYQNGPYDLYTKAGHWGPERDRLITSYFPARTAVVVNLFRGFKPAALYPAVGAPVFQVNGSYRHGGQIASTDTFSMVLPAGTSGRIYYTLDGSDPRLPSTGAVEYKGPIRLAGSAVVKARVRSSGEWSALNEAVYGVGPVVQSLRVTELMYHPLDTGDPADPNAEFIELANVGAAAIDLNLVRFTQGIGYVFGGLVLEPGQYVLVVKDLDVFTARYGEGLPVAGVYEGSLSNAGERIRLEDAVGRVIQDFEYKDGWYKGTDGRGYSLVVRGPGSVDPGSLGDKDSWLASPGIGGSPGQGDLGQ